jgi:hypothetical protein
MPRYERELRKVGDRIPKRIVRVTQIRLEHSDGHRWIVYELSDSLRKPMGGGC